MIEFGKGPVFVIAEAGSNHGGSLARALKLIDLAANAGADAVKFQMFRADKFIVPRENPEALRRYEMPNAWLPTLRERCMQWGIDFLCTAFDLASLDLVDPFVRAHKVGSYEAAAPSIWEAVLSKGKPILISNGLNRRGHWHSEHVPVVTLQCVSKYPAPLDGYLSGVGAAPMWGLSDHTLDPTIVPCAAVALGACVVEKHFRDDEGGDTPDASHSIGPADFEWMVRSIRRTELALG